MRLKAEAIGEVLRISLCSVIPAKAGTHKHRVRSSIAEVERIFRQHRAYGSRPSPG